jgi:hypothetical protein
VLFATAPVAGALAGATLAAAGAMTTFRTIWMTQAPFSSCWPAPQLASLAGELSTGALATGALATANATGFVATVNEVMPP